MPTEFATYQNYCRNLKFEDKPDIGYLRKILKDLFHKQGYEYDHKYDWMDQKICIPRNPKENKEDDWWEEQDQLFHGKF